MRVDYEILSKLSMNKLLYIKIIWNAKNIIDQLELQHSSGRLTFVFFFFKLNKTLYFKFNDDQNCVDSKGFYAKMISLFKTIRKARH